MKRRRQSAHNNALARHWLLEQINRQRPHFIGRPGGHKPRKSKHGMAFTPLPKPGGGK
jgi:hypothetical protein